MQQIYLSQHSFVHAVRYRDAMVRAWMKRTGGEGSYIPEELPAYIDPPTNAQRSLAEVYEFTNLRPLKHGESYLGYLVAAKPDSGYQGAIATWTGDVLANVTRITSYRVTDSGLTDSRGSFWAIGIDGRTYYGRHNGKGMYCRMRLAKWTDEFNVEMHGAEGWETVTSANTHKVAREHLKEYRENAPEFAYRIKREKVRQ